jgi:hypothetical protein
MNQAQDIDHDFEARRAAQNAQIAEALENAKAHKGIAAVVQRNTDAARNAGPFVDPQGQLVMLAPSPVDYLKQAIKFNHSRWIQVPYGPKLPDHQVGAARAADAIACLDDALERLGARRRGDTFEYLTSKRTEIASAFAAFESVGANFDGPAFVALVARIAEGRAEGVAVESAHESAKTARELVAARALADDFEIASRALDADIAALVEALKFPEIPSPDWFREARLSTLDLEAKAGKRPSCRAVADAIESGFRTEPAIARLWICYETQPEHELLKFRARALAEAL